MGDEYSRDDVEVEGQNYSANDVELAPAAPPPVTLNQSRGGFSGTIPPAQPAAAPLSRVNPKLLTALPGVEAGERIGQDVSKVATAGRELATAQPGRASLAPDYGSSNPVERGNIQWSNRPKIPMPGGKYGTVYSESRNEDGLEVLYPRIFDGKLHSSDDAWQHYKQTGEHMGKFRNAKDADTFSINYHNDAAAGKYDNAQSRSLPYPSAARSGLLPPPAVDPDQPRREEVLAQGIEGAFGLAAPAMIATGAAAPIEAATGLAMGYGTSKAAKYGIKAAGGGPEAQHLGEELGWLVSPTALLKPEVGIRSTPEGSGVVGSILGGKAGAGVAVTPEGVTLKGKVGPLEGTKTFKRGKAAKPAIEPPTIEGQGEFTDAEIAEAQAATNYAGPDEARAQAIATRQTNLAAAEETTNAPAEAPKPAVAPPAAKPAPEVISPAKPSPAAKPAQYQRSDVEVASVEPTAEFKAKDVEVQSEAPTAAFTDEDRRAIQDAENATGNLSGVNAAGDASRISRAAMQQVIGAQTLAGLNGDISVQRNALESGAIQGGPRTQQYIGAIIGRDDYAGLSDEEKIEAIKDFRAQQRAGTAAFGFKTQQDVKFRDLVKPGAASEAPTNAGTDRQLTAGNEASPPTGKAVSQPEAGAPAPAGTVAEAPAKLTTEKGDKVKLPDGRTGTVEYSAPADKLPVVRVKTDDGENVKLTKQAEIDALQPPYKYGSTQANIPEGSEAHEALEAARGRISTDDLAGKGTDVGGNHVTVRYGIKNEDVEGVKKYLASLSPFEASLGKTEKFPPSESSDGAAVLHAPIEAPELHQINAELEKHGEFTEPSFKDYKPHATVAYVKPETVDRYVGMNVTAGAKFPVKEIAITDRQGKQTLVKLEGKKAAKASGESKPATPAAATTPLNSPESAIPKPKSTSEKGTEVDFHQSEITRLKGQYQAVSEKIGPVTGSYGPDKRTLVEKANAINKEIREHEDSLARLRGEPTRAEKRELQKKEAEKSFAERPKEALSYSDPKHSQHWQVLEPDFIERRFQDKIKTYERGIAEKQAEFDEAKPGSKKRADALMSLEFWKKMLDRFKERDPKLAQSFKTEYLDLVKKAISQGKPVPEAVIAQKREFETAQDARERYEKGRHTSFANKSAAINDTMQKEEGFKVKRQDGKPITEEQIDEIRGSVKDIEKVFGPMKDIMSGIDLTIVHTSGTYPFLMNDAAGLYNDSDRRITLGVEGAWTGKPYPVFAHEFGHLVDIKGGSLLGKKARVYTKGGKGYDSTSLAEAESYSGGASPLIDAAKKSINDLREVKDLFRLMDAKKASELTEEEKTKAEMVKVKLGPYFYEPREIFARLFEQYVGNKLGRKGPGNMSPESYARVPGYWTQPDFDKLVPQLEQAIAKRMDALKEHFAPKADEVAPAPKGTTAELPPATPVAAKAYPEPTPGPKPETNKTLQESVAELDSKRATDPMASFLLNKLDKAFAEKRGGLSDAQYAVQRYASSGWVSPQNRLDAKSAAVTGGQTYEQWVAGGRKGMGPMAKAGKELSEKWKQEDAERAAVKVAAGLEKTEVSPPEPTKAEKVFIADVKKRAAALQATVDRLSKEIAAPLATYQDPQRSAAARDERSTKIRALSAAERELRETVAAHKWELAREVKPPKPEGLPDAAKNEHAFYREYFTQSLQPALDAWKEHLGPGFANAAKNGVKGKNLPAAFPEQQLFVDIPGDGKFLVNNDPKVLSAVIRGAPRGFAKPGTSETNKPPKIWKMPAQSEASKWNYLDRMADEVTDAGTQEEKDAALETIENLLGFTPMSTMPAPGTIVEYRGQRWYTNGSTDYGATKKTVNLIPEDSPEGRATKAWASDGGSKPLDNYGTTRDKIDDVTEPAPRVLLKAVGKLEGLKPPTEKTAEPAVTAESRVVPGARSAATGNETGTTSIQDLTDSISRQVGQKSSVKTRVKLGADMAEAREGFTDAVSSALARLKGGMAALWDAYARPPHWTDYEDATGKWSGADQSNALDLERFTKAIRDAVPDKTRRVAISNWIEAGGDDTVLRERADKSKAPYKKGYEAALALTDAEQTIARNIMNRNDATLEEAQKAGLLQQGVENYVRHIYADNPKMERKVMAELNFNSLQTKPSFTKQRTLPTYFDAEQLGFIPKDKDVGFLTASHERAFREALAARDYIKSLMEGEAADGRPLVVTSWASAKELPASEGEKSAAYLVKPNIKAEEEFVDYRRIDHPALRGWRWAGKTSEGEPIFVQGDALVHPDIYRKLSNNLGRSAIRAFQVDLAGHAFRPGNTLLNVSSEIKHAILSFSGFHQTTLGIHGLEHRTLPIGMPDLDLNQPDQRFLVDHGLNVAQYDAAEAFSEGVASGGLVTKIPIIGPAYHAYVDYLFKDYLPRVKMSMGLHALARNRDLYGGKLSDNQIGALTARQANAAFGGLNYKMLGRNKTFQDVLRLALMAPDFTEARARFAGQAAKPYGREQLVALLGGALALYATARLLNEMLDDNPHWDKPFTLVRGGKEYSLRTVQGDVVSALTKPGQYVRNRLSPLGNTSIQALEGRDRFGHKQTLWRLGQDMARSNVPIPVQPWSRESDDTLAKKALSTILKMVGVNEAKSLSEAMKKAAELRQENSGDHERTPEQREHWRKIREAIQLYHESNGQDYSAAEQVAPMLTKYERDEMKAGMQMPPLSFAVRGLPAEDVFKVYEKGTEQEKKELLEYHREAFKKILANHMRAAAEAEASDKPDTAKSEGEQAQKLMDEFSRVGSAAAASPGRSE